MLPRGLWFIAILGAACADDDRSTDASVGADALSVDAAFDAEPLDAVIADATEDPTEPRDAARDTAEPIDAQPRDAAADAAPDVDVAPDARTDAGSTASCRPRDVTCDEAEPTCDFGFGPSVVDGCYGPCVRIESCPCEGPDDCPNPEQYTCFNFAQHCGPYL